LNSLGVDDECDRQTDRRTDRTAVSNSAFSGIVKGALNQNEIYPHVCIQRF